MIRYVPYEFLELFHDSNAGEDPQDNFSYSYYGDGLVFTVHINQADSIVSLILKHEKNHKVLATIMLTDVARMQVKERRVLFFAEKNRSLFYDSTLEKPALVIELKELLLVYMEIQGDETLPISYDGKELYSFFGQKEYYDKTCAQLEQQFAELRTKSDYLNNAEFGDLCDKSESFENYPIFSVLCDGIDFGVQVASWSRSTTLTFRSMGSAFTVHVSGINAWQVAPDALYIHMNIEKINPLRLTLDPLNVSVTTSCKNVYSQFAD